jgi:hypothetical protein
MSPLVLLALLYLMGGKKPKPHVVVHHPYVPQPAALPYAPYAPPPVLMPAVYHPAAAPPAWPAAIPAGLPPFPGPGWVPDSPPPQLVVARAFALLPQLWQRGEGSSTTEQTAGRWITYVARMVGVKKSVLAYRLAQPTTPVVAPVMPGAPVAMAPPGIVPAVYHPTAAPVPMPIPVHPAAAPPPHPATPLPTLKLTHPNTKGPSVIYLQQRLGIPADGVFGTSTDHAVRAFQTAHGLQPDGVVGPATWHALG